MSQIFSKFALVGTLALCVELGVGIRSCSHCDALWHARGPGDQLTVTSEFGKLAIEVEPKIVADIKPGWVYFASPLPRLWPRKSDFGGFVAYRTWVRHYLLLPRTPLWGVGVPHWFIAVVLALPGLIWLTRYRRELVLRLRRVRGLCLACGYDLTGNQSGVCPECGTARAPADQSSQKIFVRQPG